MITLYRSEHYKEGLRMMWEHILSSVPVPRKMIELGVAYGESAAVHWEMNPDMTLYLIDPWNSYTSDCHSVNGDDMYNSVSEYFKGNNRVHLLKGTGAFWLDSFYDENIDFIYIDANHEEEPFRQDVNMYLPKVKEGGWIGGHDYTKTFQGLMNHVDTLSRLSDSYLHVFPDTSWLIQKTKNVVLAQHKDAQ